MAGSIASIASSDRPAARLNLTGSVSFSIGAILAVIEARDAADRLGHPPTLGALWSTDGGRAALVQLVAAAIFFQIATIAATLSDLGWIDTDLWLWTPSSIGSVGFVVSGAIYAREARPARDIGALITVLNLAGSTCFLAGSLGGYLAQGPVHIPGNDFVNPVFLAGSALFLLGSVIGFIELRQPLKPHQTTRHCSGRGSPGLTSPAQP